MSCILAVICAALIVVCDQVTKYLVMQNFELFQSVPLIDGILNLTYIHNRGAAFGILQNQRWFFLFVTAVLMIGCIFLLVRRVFKSKWMFWAICIILGGGIGNMIDRIFRDGNVVDFLEFEFIEFPIFNVADIAVCVGAAMVFLYFIVDIAKDMKNGKKVTEELSENGGAEE